MLVGGGSIRAYVKRQGGQHLTRKKTSANGFVWLAVGWSSISCVPSISF